LGRASVVAALSFAGLAPGPSPQHPQLQSRGLRTAGLRPRAACGPWFALADNLAVNGGTSVAHAPPRLAAAARNHSQTPAPRWPLCRRRVSALGPVGPGAGPGGDGPPPGGAEPSGLAPGHVGGVSADRPAERCDGSTSGRPEAPAGNHADALA